MNVIPTIYNTLSGWMSRYPFSSKQTSTKHAIRTWGHSSDADSSCGGHSQSTTAAPQNDLILTQLGVAWEQAQIQPQPQPHPHPHHCHQHQGPYQHHQWSRPAAPPSPSPSTSSAIAEESFVSEPRRSNNLFIESQIALAAAQRRFLLSVVRATESHLEGRVNQDEVAMFGHFYPDARSRLNQGFSGQNHLRLDEWDHSLERARRQFGMELKEIAQKMQYLHVDAMLELIGDDDSEFEMPTMPVTSLSTSLPTPATSPEPSRKRSLDDTEEKAINIKAANISQPRPLKRARIEIVKSEDRDFEIPPFSSSPSSLSLSAAAEALMGSSPSSTTLTPAPTSPKRPSQNSAAPRRRRRSTRATRSGTKKSH